MTHRLLTDCYPWFRLQKHAGEWRADGAANARYGERLSGSSLTEQGVTGGWVYENGTLIVENDALGFLPIFISHSDKDFIVAPSPLVIAALKGGAQLDPEAMAFFLKFGYFIEEDTPFAGVTGLAPGSRLIWRNGVIEQTSLPLRAPAPIDVSLDDALDRYNALFAQSMERRRPAPGATALIPLSGGRDSRHIALEAAKQQLADRRSSDSAHFLAVTSSLWRTKDANTPETVTAKRVAAHIGMAHETVPAISDVIANEARKNLLSGFCCDEASLISGLISQVPPPGCVYDGIGGDVLSDGDCCQPDFYKHIAEQNSRAFIDLLFPYDDRVGDILWPFLKPIAVGRDKPSSGAHLVNRVDAQLERVREFANPAVAYFFFTRTRREISLAPFMLWGAAERAYAPFLDYDLVMYLLALPARHFQDGLFHTTAIARAYPDAAGIAYGDVSTTPSRPAQIAMMAQVMASSFIADPKRPLAGARSSLAFFSHYFRAGGRGANWRLLNLVLQLVRLLRKGPQSAHLSAGDEFSFSCDREFRPREAPRASA